jgi:hyperosmotically inducible protein
MKRILFGFILGAATGAWGYWYFQQEDTRSVFRGAGTSMVAGVEKVTTSIQEKVSEIRTDDIKRELEHSGMVVREKARQAGSALSDATVNTRTTAAIKGKLITEPGVSAMSINVDTSEGLVTLSGTVASHEQIAKAVRIAMDTDGVNKVISTLQVKPK